MDPFPPPGLTNFFLVGAEELEVVPEAEGEPVSTVGVDVKLLSGQSFVQTANSLQ